LIFYKKYGIIKWGIYLYRTALETFSAYAAPIVESYYYNCGNLIKPFGTAIPHMPPHIAINNNSPPDRPLVKIFTKFAPWRNRIWPYIIKNWTPGRTARVQFSIKVKSVCMCKGRLYEKNLWVCTPLTNLSNIFV